MKISTKGIYALEAMIELNTIDNNDFVSINLIATRRNCSSKYLEQIFKALKASGIVESTRGKNGGYRLSRDPDMITAKDIVMAVEKRLDPVLCLSQSCPRELTCKTRPIWQGMQTEIFDVLQSKSLTDLTRAYINEVKK